MRGKADLAIERLNARAARKQNVANGNIRQSHKARRCVGGQYVANRVTVKSCSAVSGLQRASDRAYKINRAPCRHIARVGKQSLPRSARSGNADRAGAIAVNDAVCRQGCGTRAAIGHGQRVRKANRTGGGQISERSSGRCGTANDAAVDRASRNRNAADRATSDGDDGNIRRRPRRISARSAGCQNITVRAGRQRGPG